MDIDLSRIDHYLGRLPFQGFLISSLRSLKSIIPFSLWIIKQQEWQEEDECVVGDCTSR